MGASMADSRGHSPASFCPLQINKSRHSSGSPGFVTRSTKQDMAWIVTQVPRVITLSGPFRTGHEFVTP